MNLLRNKWARAALLATPLALSLGFQGYEALNDDTVYTDVSYSEFLDSARSGTISDIVTEGKEITGTVSEKEFLQSYAPMGESIAKRLIDEGIDIDISEKAPGRFSGAGKTALSLLPMAMLTTLYMSSPTMRKALGIGGSAKFEKRTSDVRFSDVAGIDEAKEDLQEIVGFLKHPEKFEKVGAAIPKGAILVGPPGTGKTLLAKAVAGEAGVPFYSVSGSEFVEMYVGVGASRIRDLFKTAKENSPCIVFIDEIDALAKSRSLLRGNDEKEQTLNQLLVELDGFSSGSDNIVVIGATNLPDELDPAVKRAGRLGREIYVPTPDIQGRESILAVHMQKISVAESVDIPTIAKATPGFSGADLAALVNEAAIRAGKDDRAFVTQEDFEKARDKIIMGAERKIKMSDEERLITAYHEAGHAIVSIFAEGNHPLEKVSIIPRGQALGVTLNMPEEDRYHVTKPQLMGQIATLFGGREAEKILLGENNYTSGAVSDIEKATEKARRMVCEWGMSDLGPIRFSQSSGANHLGGSFEKSSAISDDTSLQIDEAVKGIIDDGQANARQILTEHKEKLEDLAKALMDEETLSAKQVYAILGIEQPQMLLTVRANAQAYRHS